MENRYRKHRITLRLSDDENRILEGKWRISGMKSKSSFLRQQIVEGMVYEVDYSWVRDYNVQLGKIGTNINQIAHKVNGTGEITDAEIAMLKKEMDEIWRLQRSMLSKFQFPKQ